ncbi:MAG: methyltransferase domain-containing protein [Bacteroidetes bacterium]|nr:methyltransferase domain-containing protein [Bacteroidota bacterium]
MGMLTDIIKKEQFNPGIIGIFTNPFYFSRRGLFRAMRDLGSELSGRLLDIGCGTKPYEPYLSVQEYIGVEIDTERSRTTSKADLFYDGTRIPCEDGAFDAVLANEVFEHVFNPDAFLMEVNRVLKPGGKFLITVPFVWDEHEQPHDYARYTSFGLVHILRAHGFEVVRHSKSVSDTRVIFQLINEYIYKKTYVQSPVLRQLLNTLLISPWTCLGIVLSAVLPSNPDLYLDNIILVRKVSNA